MSSRKGTIALIKSRPPFAPELHLGSVTTRTATFTWSYPTNSTNMPHEPVPSKESITFTLQARLASTSVSEMTTHYKGHEMAAVAEGLFPNEGYIARLIIEWVDPPKDAEPAITEMEFHTPDESELHKASAQLQRAVADNDVFTASKLLNQFGKELTLETRDKYGRTLLMSACQNGGPELISTLVQHGANTEAKTASGKTPLIFACSNGNLHAVQILLDHKVPIDRTDSAGTTPLMIVCENISNEAGLAILHSLLISGADVNIEDQGGRTALDRLCIVGGSNNVEAARALVESGARLINRPDKKHPKTNLMMAALNGHAGLCRYLIESCHQDANVKTDLGGTARVFAEANGHMAVVQLFDQIVWGSSSHAPTVRVADN